MNIVLIFLNAKYNLKFITSDSMLTIKMLKFMLTAKIISK